MGEDLTVPTDMSILHYPDPRLRRPSRPVSVFDDDLRTFCQQMFTQMAIDHGVGLAAPQVGVDLRLFVTDHHAGREDVLPDRRVWINPRFEHPGGTAVWEEGCLSVPGIYANVERAANLDVVYQDEFGKEHRTHLDYDAGDFLAIVVQHEADHLDGALFIDHLSAPQLALVRRRLKELEKAYKKATGKAGAILRR